MDLSDENCGQNFLLMVHVTYNISAVYRTITLVHALCGSGLLQSADKYTYFRIFAKHCCDRLANFYLDI